MIIGLEHDRARFLEQIEFALELRHVSRQLGPVPIRYYNGLQTRATIGSQRLESSSNASDFLTVKTPVFLHASHDACNKKHDEKSRKAM